MLSSTKNRYVIRGVESSSSRAGMFLQMPSLLHFKADQIMFPDMSFFRAGFFQTVINLSTARLALQEKRKDIFQLIKDAKDPETGGSLPINEVVSECTLLIVAGSDTSSTVLAALFFYLAKYPRVYAKLSDEIRTNFSSYDEIRGGQPLNKCQYLRACLDEAMRMAPPVGGAAWREAQKGGAVVDGHVIPEGFDAGVACYAIHHKKDYYRKPFEFVPERWMAGDEFTAEDVTVAKAAFNPFSLGNIP
jgi:cytochrome P450